MLRPDMRSRGRRFNTLSLIILQISNVGQPDHALDPPEDSEAAASGHIQLHLLISALLQTQCIAVSATIASDPVVKDGSIVLRSTADLKLRLIQQLVLRTCHSQLFCDQT